MAAAAAAAPKATTETPPEMSSGHKALLAACDKAAMQLLKATAGDITDLPRIAGAIRLWDLAAMCWRDANGLSPLAETPYTTESQRATELYIAALDNLADASPSKECPDPTPDAVQAAIQKTGLMGSGVRPTLDAKQLATPPDVVVYRQSMDGMACVKLFKAYYGDAVSSKIDFRAWPINAPPNLDGLEGKRVCIADATVPFGLVTTKLVKAKHTWMFDHTTNQANKVLDAILAVEPRPYLTYVLDTTEMLCGAMILYLALFSKKPHAFKWLDVINKNDTNIRLKTEEEKAYYAFLNRPEATETLKAFEAACAADVKEAAALGTKLLEERRNEAKVAMGSMELKKQTKIGNAMYNIGYATVSAYDRVLPCSELVAKYPEIVKDMDLWCVRWTDAKTKTKHLALRQRPGSALDMSAIAKHFGGGGQPAASGVQGRDYL
jgi:hypothetical protein